jgi:excisionase family DNA binding protein
MALANTMSAARDAVLSDDRRLMKPEDVAAYLSVSRSKVYQLLASGELPSVKQGGNRRVRLSALNAYIDRLERDSAPTTGVMA